MTNCRDGGLKLCVPLGLCRSTFLKNIFVVSFADSLRIYVNFVLRIFQIRCSFADRLSYKNFIFFVSTRRRRFGSSPHKPALDQRAGLGSKALILGDTDPMGLR